MPRLLTSVCRTRRPVAVLVALLLLGMAPFAGALEIHHALAAADQDGHHHSDSDLCQWVQHHTSQSLMIAAPAVAISICIGGVNYSHPLLLLSGRPISGGPSRAPPFS